MTPAIPQRQVPPGPITCDTTGCVKTPKHGGLHGDKTGASIPADPKLSAGGGGGRR